ncbi:hypothetical protein K493DRAFT_339399 [Basidiobolus meristosporus CBS 931.73]|uniref:UPF3 domain-containing protein n=1 Tax=Basidiobolus meristosporus CBS 931.73 TaxID=1314790 RepID=A0A1Y1Y033_9FUNG|nr:hypothetical protein K493DRAFT_339399 [Basidiobolus meristosporus CBS 931.73]|eukprot:ORX91373.1 hypothetical protein K493DRAFT_339399 [Basidiobolus meristosporus CBS 931.73]
MTTSPNDQANPEAVLVQKKAKKTKRKPRAKKSNKRVEGPKTKVVIRRLPPNLPEELFFKSIQPYITDENIDWKLYVPGKISTNKNKENHFSRGYLHFKTIDDVILFHRGYDGHLFVDSKGNESRAVVEFAPFQKIPKENQKPDPREGTLEEDPDYLAFLETLKEEKENKESNGISDGTTQLEKLEARLSKESVVPLSTNSTPKSTPLLDYLRAQKAASKSKKKNQSGKQAPVMILTNRKKGGAGGNGGNANGTSTGAKTDSKPKKPSKKERERRRKERAKEKGEAPEALAKPAKDVLPPKPPKSSRPRKERDPNPEGGNKEKPPKKKGNKSNKPPKEAGKGQKPKDLDSPAPKIMQKPNSQPKLES